MTTLDIVAVVCGIFAVGLVLLLIYRSTLTIHEDDQLFLSDANSQMQQEQTQLLSRVNQLRLPIWVFGGGTGVFALILLGLWISQKLAEASQ
jgi:hypothetical protein